MVNPEERAMHRKYPTSTSKCSGFSLIETLAALAISSAMVMIVGAGLFFVLQQERAALQTRRASLMSKSVESFERLESLRENIDGQYAEHWLIHTNHIERDDIRWNEWRVAPRDSNRPSTSLFFLDKEGVQDI